MPVCASGCVMYQAGSRSAGHRGASVTSARQRLRNRPGIDDRMDRRLSRTMNPVLKVAETEDRRHVDD